MDQIYEIAFKYYVNFYSYKGKFKELRWWMLLTIILGFLFSYTAVVDIKNMHSINAEGFELYWGIRWTVFYEIIFLLSFFILDGKRDEVSTRNFSNFSKNSKLVLAKRTWIKRVCDVDESGYLGFAEDIMKMKGVLHESCGNAGDDRFGFFRFIYSPESKGRITSYLIFIFSIFSLASLKDISGISEIFLAFNDDSYKKSILLLMVMGGAIFFIAMGILYFIKLISWGLDVAWLLFTGSKKTSYRFVNVFVSDLIKLHRLPHLKASTGGGR